MPLHLLPKKSWNVYNPENIERVKRDEAEAHRQAVEQENRNLQDEADDRIRHLKQHVSKDRKTLKRKLPGEDETEREIRLAAEGTATSTGDGTGDHASFLDASGHIALIPPPQKKPRQEQEKDPYTVYLADATGRDKRSEDTWYTSLQPGKRSWGDDNPRKQQRELARMNTNDPLAAMKKGVKALRENDKARKEWMKQRERDMHEVERLARQDRHERKRRKRRDCADDDLESLEEFTLNEGYAQTKKLKNSHDLPAQGERRHRHHHRSHGRRHEHRDLGQGSRDTTRDGERGFRAREENERWFQREIPG